MYAKCFVKNYYSLNLTDESASVFTLSEMEGVLPASTDMKDITHAITVTYTPT